MNLDGNGEQGRDGTFSSKKVDWTQESGSPRRRRKKRQERTRGQVTSRDYTSKSLSYRHPSPKVSLGHRQRQTAQPHFSAEGVIFPQFFAGGGLSIKESPCLCPPSPHLPGDDPTAAVLHTSVRAAPLPSRQAGRQAGLREDSRTFPPLHPMATSAILTYNNDHDDGTDGSQHDHHLGRHDRA